MIQKQLILFFFATLEERIKPRMPYVHLKFI